MADEQHPTHDSEFDGYVVDTRRRARWTESTRRPERAAGPSAGQREDSADRYGNRPAERGDRRAASSTTTPEWGGQTSPRGAERGRAGGIDRTRAMPTVAPPAARPVSAPPPPPRAPRGSTRVPGRRRIRWGRLVALLVALWLAFLVITPLHAWSTAHRADTTPQGERPTNQGGHNYLLLGSDSRVGMSAKERERLGASNADGQRTDSIILVHVPEHGGKAALISVPRDSYVPIPGHGSHKINAAYSLGGARLLTETLEQVGGFRIDGTLEIGFGGFSDVVDSVGGVTLCPQWDMKDPEAGIDLKKGCQTMSGPNALGYVRTRHTDPRGDLGRADRQREFLGALMKKAVSPATVLLPWRYWGFTHSAAGSVQMSDNLGMGDVARVLQTMRGTGSGDTLSLMMPISNMGYPTADGSAVKWNSEQARALFSMIQQDTPMDAAPAGTNG